MSKSKWFPNRGVRPSPRQLPLPPSNVLPSPKLTLQHHHQNPFPLDFPPLCIFQCIPQIATSSQNPCFCCFSNCQGAERENKFWSNVVCQHSGSHEMPGQSQHIVFREKITQRKGRGKRKKERERKKGRKRENITGRGKGEE